MWCALHVYANQHSPLTCIVTTYYTPPPPPLTSPLTHSPLSEWRVAVFTRAWRNCGRKTERIHRAGTLHCTILYCTALHHTALQCTTLHCTILRYATLHCTALPCITNHTRWLVNQESSTKYVLTWLHTINYFSQIVYLRDDPFFPTFFQLIFLIVNSSFSHK